MDSIDFSRLDELVDESRGGILGVFEVLQEIAGTVMLVALHDPMSELLRLKFYVWYGSKLVKLHARAEQAAAAVRYQQKLYDPARVTLSRIEAVVGTLASLGVLNFLKEELARIEEEQAGAA